MRNIPNKYNGLHVVFFIDLKIQKDTSESYLSVLTEKKIE